MPYVTFDKPQLLRGVRACDRLSIRRSRGLYDSVPTEYVMYSMYVLYIHTPAPSTRVECRAAEQAAREAPLATSVRMSLSPSAPGRGMLLQLGCITVEGTSNSTSRPGCVLSVHPNEKAVCLQSPVAADAPGRQQEEGGETASASTGREVISKAANRLRPLSSRESLETTT